MSKEKDKPGGVFRRNAEGELIPLTRGVNPMSRTPSVTKTEPYYQRTISERPEGSAPTVIPVKVGLDARSWGQLGRGMMPFGTPEGVGTPAPKTKKVDVIYLDSASGKMKHTTETVNLEIAETRGVVQPYGVSRQGGLDLGSVYNMMQSEDPVEHLQIDPPPPQPEPTRGGLVTLQDSIEHLRRSLDKLTGKK